MTRLLLIVLALSIQGGIGPGPGTPHVSGGGGSCVTTPPVSDTFSGSGALCSAWTQTSASGFVPLVRSSGFAVPNTSSSQGMAVFTGASFSSVQYSQAALTWQSGNYSGVCVGMSVSGTGACYFPNIGDVYSVLNGSGVGSIVTGCSSLPSGNTVKLDVASGPTYTVTDITTSTVLCTGSGGAAFTGSPAIIVDQRSGSTDKITNFGAQ